MSTLDRYIDITSNWRKDNNNSQLLLSYIKPHNAVVTSTISGWIKQILKFSGIDIEMFKGHSTRSASSSCAGMSGLSVSDILKRGCWSKETTWERFYNKPVMTSEEKFQEAVIQA